MSDQAAAAAAGDMLAAALALSGSGYAVFPLKPRGKVPATIDGFKSASTDPAVIGEWWRRWPTANVGVATGAVSGVVVLDVDVPAGLRSLAELERRHGKLATARVLTQSGGSHFWFRAPAEGLRNSAGRLGEGLDTRGDGGYVVAPPSIGETGNPYSWTRGLDRLTDCPAWLLADAAERRNGGAAPVGDEIPQGQRDTTLASLAGSMRRRGMGEAEIVAALMVANETRCKPPLPAGDVQRIAASIAAKEPDEPEPFTLTLISARELCAQPDPERTGELLGPLVVERYRTVLGGHTGEGKTTLALAMLAAIGHEADLFGYQGAGSIHALMLDAEQGAKSLKRRLRETGLDTADWLDVVRVPDGLQLDADPRHVAELDRVLRGGGYNVIVADPFYKLHAGDSNAEREAVDLMRRFDAWRDELGFALILPVHCRKPVPGMKFSIHDLFGSSAYVRGAEVVIGLQRLRDGYSRLHYLKDRDGDLPIGAAWGLLFDRDEGFRRDPDDGKHEPTTIEQVAELLEQTPGMTKTELADATGRKPRTVEAALRELGAVPRRRGGVGGRGENEYTLPDSQDPTRIRLASDSQLAIDPETPTRSPQSDPL